MDNAYIKALNNQIAEWQRMYDELKHENERLKKEIAEPQRTDPGSLPENRDAGKLRHV